METLDLEVEKKITKFKDLFYEECKTAGNWRFSFTVVNNGTPDQLEDKLVALSKELRI